MHIYIYIIYLKLTHSEQNEYDSFQFEPPQIIDNENEDVDQSQVLILGANDQITKSLKTYFEKILFGNQNRDNIELFNYLKTSPAIQPLVPFFVQLDQKYKNFQDTIKLLQIFRCLIMNQSINTDAYIHKFISLSLSILLTVNENKESEIDEYIIYREEAAKILSNIIKKSKDKFPFLRPEIAQKLSSIFFNPITHRNKQYSAALGLQALGNDILKVYLLPHLTVVLESLEKDLQNNNYITRFKASRLKGLLFRICSNCFNSEFYTSDGKIVTLSKDVAIMYNKIGAYFDYQQLYSFIPI